MDEIEKMRRDFEQERLSLRAEHEKEMEELRIYFEQKSSSAEETYREELEILHQRLREMSDDEKGEMTLNCSTLTLEESFESDKMDLLQHFTDQLEEHKVRLVKITLVQTWLCIIFAPTHLPFSFLHRNSLLIRALLKRNTSRSWTTYVQHLPCSTRRMYLT